MSEYTCTVRWARYEAPFADLRYSRVHEWRFDGGVVVPASASPHVVPVPLSDPACVDPEEAFVAAIASCHMLTFLWLAAKTGVVVDGYADDAAGVLETDATGRKSVTRVTLRPEIRFADGHRPSDAQLRRLHDEAHEQCFIANSVKSVIEVALPR